MEGKDYCKKCDQDGSESSSNSGRIALKKEIGLHNAVAIIVGVIVGSGIFISPKGVLLEAGSVGLSLSVWGMCGMISLIGALCYAELGTCILKSGADYAYIMAAFGHLPAFLYLWVALIIIMPTGNAITAMTFANYVLQPLFPSCDAPPIAASLLAAICITILTVINCVNVKWATRVQDIFTVAKILALIMIIVTGLVKFCLDDYSKESFQEPFEGSANSMGAVALSFYSGLFSFSGWNYLNFVTEELKDPYRNLPRAIWISIPLVTIVYVSANVAYFVVLTPQELLASDAVAVTFAQRTYGVMAWVMPLFVACSTFGSVNGAIFTSARLYFVGARQGHLPGCLATISVKNYTPTAALIFGCIMSLVMLGSSDIYALINYTSFVESSFIGISIAGLLWLRYTRPDMERPIKVKQNTLTMTATLIMMRVAAMVCIGFPIFFLIICIFLMVLPLTTSPVECFMGLIMIATGIPVYLIGVCWKDKPAFFTKALRIFTVLSQKVCLSVPEDYKEK